MTFAPNSEAGRSVLEAENTVLTFGQPVLGSSPVSRSISFRIRPIRRFFYFRDTLPERYLDNIGDNEIADVNIPTGIPLVYEIDEELKPLTHFYLGDAEKVRKASNEVAGQGKMN